MDNFDQSLKGNDLIDNQVVEFAETCANNRINALMESLNDLRRSHRELQVEHDEYMRDTEELLSEARAQRTAADTFKRNILALFGITLPLSDDDVVDLVRHVLDLAAKVCNSHVALSGIMDALAAIREEMLLDEDASPKEIATSVCQYVNLNNHLLNVIYEITTQRLGSRTQSLDTLKNCTPEEALAERVRNLRELAKSAKYHQRLTDLFDAAVEAASAATIHKEAPEESESERGTGQ